MWSGSVCESCWSSDWIHSGLIHKHDVSIKGKILSFEFENFGNFVKWVLLVFVEQGNKKIKLLPQEWREKCLSYGGNSIHGFIWYNGNLPLPNSRLWSAMVALHCGCCHVFYLLHNWTRPRNHSSCRYNNFFFSLTQLNQIQNLTRVSFLRQWKLQGQPYRS